MLHALAENAQRSSLRTTGSVLPATLVHGGHLGIAGPFLPLIREQTRGLADGRGGPVSEGCWLRGRDVDMEAGGSLDWLLTAGG